MTNALTPPTPAMAGAGARVLRSLPWSGEVVDPMEVARKVWRAMDHQRQLDERETASRRDVARVASLTSLKPWNTLQARGAV